MYLHLYHITLYYIILYYTILYYIILYYVILYHESPGLHVPAREPRAAEGHRANTTN